MSHIIEEEVDAPIRSKTSQAYRDNYDRIFGDEPGLKTGENTEDVADAPLAEYGGEPAAPRTCPSCGQASHGDDLCGDLKR